VSWNNDNTKKAEAVASSVSTINYSSNHDDALPPTTTIAPCSGHLGLWAANSADEVFWRSTGGETMRSKPRLDANPAITTTGTYHSVYEM